MILQNEPNIREVIASPKTGDARDPMMQSPSELDDKQLKEPGLKIEKPAYSPSGSARLGAKKKKMNLLRQQSRSRIFFVSFLASLPIWWGTNVFSKNLENFLFLQEMDKSQILTAQLTGALNSPSALIRKREVPDLEVEAKSVLSFFIGKDGKEKILYQNNIDSKLLVASITKLMTADIVLEYYELSQAIEISKWALSNNGNNLSNFKTGEVFTAEQLLRSLLVESNNVAAIALASAIGQKGFVELMNLEAGNIGLTSTSFSNPVGWDSEDNYSSAQDLVKLTKHLLLSKKLIWDILSAKEESIYFADGNLHHLAKNTNELLGIIPMIIGGKTGETSLAGGCLLLVIEAPNNRGIIINVVLGSNDRFTQTQKLIKWYTDAYQW